MSTDGSPTLQSSYRPLANPAEFEDFLSGGRALADRDAWAEAAGYDHRARKLDFERHFRALVLLHTTDSTSARDLSDAAEENLLFQAVKSDFDISVAGFGNAMADRPIEPYWRMLGRVMEEVEELPHQRLRGIEAETWDQVTDLFGEIDLFDATSMGLPPTLCEWAETEPDGQCRTPPHRRLRGTAAGSVPFPHPPAYLSRSRRPEDGLIQIRSLVSRIALLDANDTVFRPSFRPFLRVVLPVERETGRVQMGKLRGQPELLSRAARHVSK